MYSVIKAIIICFFSVILLSCSPTNSIPMQENINREIDVLAYGADNTGKQPSQSAFENAIKDAIQSKKTLYIPSGKYQLTQTLTIENYIRIKGAGMFNTGIFLTSKKEDQWIFSFEGGAGGSEISDFSIGNENGNGIRHIYGLRSTIRNVKAGFGLSGTAFYAEESLGIRYIDVEVGTNGNNFFRSSSKPKIGFHMTSGVRFNSNQFVIERCYVAGCKEDGILLDGREHRDIYSLYGMINNTVSEGNERYGINVTHAQGVRINNSHMEANRKTDLYLNEAHSFTWNAGIINNCNIKNTHGAVFISSTIGKLDIDNASYNCTFIGGSIQLGNKSLISKGSWNDNTFIGVLRNNHDANGKGAAMIANQNLFGQIISQNGDFARWSPSSKTPDYYSLSGNPTITKSNEALLGNQSVKLTASGQHKFEGLKFDLSSFEKKYFQSEVPQRVSISVWVKYLNGFEEKGAVIVGEFNGYYNEWAKRNKIQPKQERNKSNEWIKISYSLSYSKDMDILISFPENAKKGQGMLVDALTISIGSSTPSFYASSALNSNTQLTGTKKIEHSSTPPSRGHYIKGDIIYNTEPASGQYVGWICIKSGKPGQWKPFGKIE